MLYTIIILSIVILLLAKEYLPADSVILLAITALVVTKILTPQEAFGGFGSSLVITLVSIFILGGVLKKDGVVEFFAKKLANFQFDSYPKILAIIMFPVAFLSAFMSNTSVVALTFMPFKKMANKLQFKSNRILMPLAFASLLGGTSTLIGTSTNIVGNNFLVTHGMAKIEMFEFLPIGITLVLFAYLFFIFFIKFFLGNEESNEEIFNKNTSETVDYFTEFTIGHDSKFLNKDLKVLEDLNISLHKVIRGEVEFKKVEKFEVGDILFIFGSSENLKKFYIQNSLSGFHLHHLEKKEIVEMVVLPTSRYIDYALDSQYFLKTNNFKVIAIYRQNFKMDKPMSQIHLKAGDVLVCEVDNDSIEKIFYENNFVILNKNNKNTFPNLQKGFLTLFVFLISILLSAFSILPISISLMLAVMFLVGIHIIPSNEIFKDVDWRLIILIAGMSAFGVAFTKTGLDSFIANIFTENLSFLSTIPILFILMILTVLLTQPMSNAAAALVLLPIAVKVAENLSVNPRAFSVAVILSASISMITPFEPASLLIFKIGNYKVIDFFKIGGILTLFSLLIILFYIYLMYF